MFVRAVNKSLVYFRKDYDDLGLLLVGNSVVEHNVLV